MKIVIVLQFFIIKYILIMLGLPGVKRGWIITLG